MASKRGALNAKPLGVPGKLHILASWHHYQQAPLPLSRLLISPDLKCHKSLQPLADVLGEATPTPLSQKSFHAGNNKEKKR